MFPGKIPGFAAPGIAVFHPGQEQKRAGQSMAFHPKQGIPVGERAIPEAWLQDIGRGLYSVFFACNQEFPMRKIICNESASYHGMAKVYRKNKPVMNARGLSIRYEIGEIYLKRSVFFFQRLFRCTGDLYTRDVSCLWWRFLQCFQPRADSCDGNTACQCSGDRGLQAAVAEAV